jgi:hypothetical protein
MSVDTARRNLKHLITLLEDLQALGVAFVSLAEGNSSPWPVIGQRGHAVARDVTEPPVLT